MVSVVRMSLKVNNIKYSNTLIIIRTAYTSAPAWIPRTIKYL